MTKNRGIVKILAVFAVFFAFLLAGCGQEEASVENGYSVYYLSNSETKLVVQKVALFGDGQEEQAEEMAKYLSEMPEKLEYKAPFAMVKLLSLKVLDERVVLDMDPEYKNLSATTEVLVRAAIVRSFTQIEGIHFVTITVGGEQLFDNSGRQVGLMSAEQFINNDGNEINTYELIKVRLYFANESGDKLIAANREKHYSTNTPLERFVVEELIAGPSGQVPGLYATINPETKILSVSTRDGVCYVNLDSSFLNVTGNVSTEISVYSIVNSLVELSNINKVQILVNGEVPSTFSASSFERNLDCVTTLDP